VTSRAFVALLLVSAATFAADMPQPSASTPLERRIAHTDPIFLHRGVIQPRSGIGQHFHNDCEEMFVILDGEAELTIDGRTSLIHQPPPPRKQQ
jgi:quercetin dioxygenase-like cupin family protein